MSRHASEGAYLLLGQLEGALIAADLEQLGDALLVGGQTGDLTDDGADVLDTLGEELRVRRVEEKEKGGEFSKRRRKILCGYCSALVSRAG